MPDNAINPADPYSLILAADHRLGAQDLENDMVWEAQLEGGESGGLSIYSTLSLSASSLRIIPTFTTQTQTKIHLAEFASPAIIEQVLPSYARFLLTPFTEIKCKLEYWIKESHLLLGRISIKNGSRHAFRGHVAWSVQFMPLDGGSGMKIIPSGAQPYLHGLMGKEHLIFLLSGASSAGKQGQTSLQSDISLSPGEQQIFQWAFARQNSKPAALIAVNSYLNTDWEAETARLEVNDQKELFYISSGNRDWDIAFETSQKLAQQLIVKPSISPAETIFLQSRTPDQKVPPDFNRNQFTSQLSMDALQLWYAVQVLPSMAGIVREHLTSVIKEFETLEQARVTFGFNSILKPRLPFPIIATLMRESDQWQSDREWLRDNFQALINFLKIWLEVRLEEMGSDAPFFSSALQSTFEQLPIHNRWNRDGVGINTNYILSPFLISMLLREVNEAIDLGNMISAKKDALDWLDRQKIILTDLLEQLWDHRKKHYIYADITTRNGYAGYSLFSGYGSGLFEIKKKLRKASRLTIRLFSQQEHTRNTHITISGKFDGEELVEEINPRAIHWYSQHGFYTSKNIYSSVESVKVLQLAENDSIILATADFKQVDLSLAMPLWASACNHKRATAMIDKWLIPEFMQSFGMPLVPMSVQPANNDIYNNVHLILNCFILQGLLQYNYRQQAQQLYTNTIYAVTKNLKLFHRIMRQYDASDGYGTGEYNIINGAIPISVFLNLAGIEKWTPSEVIINNTSAFESSITIRYRGYTIQTTTDGHQFSAPGGLKIETSGKGPHLIRIPR